jgi:hypothetical protein
MCSVWEACRQRCGDLTRSGPAACRTLASARKLEGRTNKSGGLSRSRKSIQRKKPFVRESITLGDN